MKHLILAACLSLGFFACGNSSTSTGTNVTPLSILGNDQTPALNGILTSNIYTGATLASGFSTNNPYWVFNSGFGNGNYIAPADGYVGEIGLAQINGVSVTYVTIIHSGHLATRMFGMQNVILRSGDTVVQGSIMGTFSNSGQVAFQVLWDNNAVCPLSYVSSSFRTALTSTGYYAQLCL